MKLRLEDKRKAILLRREGYSYNEIRNIIPDLSKGTISGWLKNIELTTEHRARIIQKMATAGEKGRLKGAWTNKRKALDRITAIQNTATLEFDKLFADPLFICALSLYWAEGAKKSRGFQFVNSDPEMIMLMIKWLHKFKVADKDIKIRLFIHSIYESEKPEEFWMRITNIPKSRLLKTIYKLTIHKIKKNHNYKGCCRIEVSGSELFWKIVKWRGMLFEKLVSPRSEMDIT